MPNTAKETALSQLKEMQGEITAIRYYNKKLSDIKKNIDSGSSASANHASERANELRREKAEYLRRAKEPAPQLAHPFDILLFVPFALFSLVLMIILYPAGSADILGGAVNRVFQVYFVLYPVFTVARQLSPKVSSFADNMSRGIRIVLLALYAVAVVFVLISVFFRPIFMLCILPLILGVLALMLKDKENARLDRANHKKAVSAVIAEYDKMIKEALLFDVEQSAKQEAELQNTKKALEAKYAEIIKECKTALIKHKAKFKEVKVIPDALMQNDMGVVDKLISIIEQGQAETVDEAIKIYQAENSNSDGEFGEIYVYVGIRRKDGWGEVRNLVYLDGKKFGPAEMPCTVIQAASGEHTISAKVQLNYGGAGHYPESEVVSLSLGNGDKKYVKFYVKGSPEVKVKICESIEELGADI